jgi:hypothetical protein
VTLVPLLLLSRVRHLHRVDWLVDGDSGANEATVIDCGSYEAYGIPEARARGNSPSNVMDLIKRTINDWAIHRSCSIRSIKCCHSG